MSKLSEPVLACRVLPRCLAALAALLGSAGCGPRDFYADLEVALTVPSPLLKERVKAGYFSPTPLGETGPSLEIALAEEGRVRESGQGVIFDAAVYLLPIVPVAVDDDVAVFAVPAVETSTELVPVVWYDDDDDGALDIRRVGALPERARVPGLERDDERLYLVSYRAIPELEMVEARARGESGRELRITDDERADFEVLLSATPDGP